MKRLIVTADDFGRAEPVNEAVEDAHKRGILTAASLMVAEEGFADAVERARSMPGLAIGLHITLVDGKPVLPPSDIPDLVDRSGRFSSQLVRLGTKIYFDRHTREQVVRELRAQFEMFRTTGLRLGHVDSHHHYHLHPTVFDIILDLAQEYDVPAIRLPWEPPLISWRAQRQAAGRRVMNGLFHWHRLRRMRRKAQAAGLLVNDRAFGLNDSGAMDATRLLGFLENLPPGLNEIYCHPATRRWADHPMPVSYRSVDEYLALIDPVVTTALIRHHITLTSFPLEAAARGNGQA